MKLSIKAGSTSQTLLIFILDSTSTTGAGLTGLAYNTGSLTCYFIRPLAPTATLVTLANLAANDTAWSSGGFKELDATNMPGWYRFDPPNAALAVGVRSVGFHFKGAANMAPLPIEVELTGWDNQDAVRGGLTALPNAVASASGGLPTFGTGTGQINPSSGDVGVTAAGQAAIADKLLGRSIVGGTDGGRTVKQVMQFQRNAWSISSNTLTVMAEDDTTPSWTATLTFGTGGLVTGFDPN